MSKTKKIAILAIIAMVLTLMPTALFAAATADDTRLAGADRIGTALEIASAGWSSADTVVLAPADQANLVDSLAAAPLAGQENAPILLTFKGSLDSAVKARIAALGAKKVYVIGAVSDAVVAEVDAIDGVTVEKLAGADRWGTADKINAKLTAPAGTFVVGYNAVPDALSVASYAAANKYAIVLANADGTVPASKLVGSTTYLVGGTGVVKDYSGATRLGGADRYATNKAVVEGLSFNFDRAYVANGLSMVDALAASSLAAKYNAPVLLSNGSSVPAGEAVKDKLGMVIALGGTGVVSDAVISSLTGEIGNVVSCAVEEKSYDDDTKNQYVAFTVNGKKVTVEALNAMGWDLEFTAGDSKSNLGDFDDIFADQTTGLLNDTVDKDDYYVQLTLTKGTDIVISKIAKITVKNLNLTATGISDYKLVLNTYKMNSTKLVVGDVATFDQITVTAGSSKEDIKFADKPFTVKTSNAGVISVDSTDKNEITAQTPGTASITLTYGNATKVISFTVVDEEREAKSMKVKKVSDGSVITSLKVLAGKTTALKAEVLDQYGDPIDNDFDVAVSNELVISPIAVSGGQFDVVSLKEGTATLTFNYDSVKLGTFTVTVSDDLTITKTALELFKVDNSSKFDALTADIADLAGLDGSEDDFSTDNTLDISGDNIVIYQVNKFNAAGMNIGADDGLTFDIDKDVVESKAGVLSDDTGLYDGGKKLVIVAGDQTGTATVKFKDTYGKLYTVKITVVNEGYNIKSISLKTPPTSDFGRTYKWSNVLNYTSAGGDSDPIVTGVTLNKAAAQEIRFEATTGYIYIDKNSDGEYAGDDVLVGYFDMAVTGNLALTAVDGVTVCVTEPGDEGTIIFKIFDTSDKIVASKSVSVDI